MIQKGLSLLSAALVVATVMSAIPTQANPPTISTAPVNILGPGGGPVAGAVSKIIRTDQGVTVSVDTVVDPGTYTMWLVVWDHPEDCEGVPFCIPTEVGGPDEPTCVVFGAGVVVGAEGTLNYTGHRSANDPFDCLTRPRDAEIHALVRTHGERISGQVGRQIRTFEGGCDINECAVIQGAVHQPAP